jgi:hypothetical protein
MAEVEDAYTELQKMGYFSPAPPLLRICPESGLRLWVPRFQIKVRDKRDKPPSRVPAWRSCTLCSKISTGGWPFAFFTRSVRWAVTRSFTRSFVFAVPVTTFEQGQ